MSANDFYRQQAEAQARRDAEQNRRMADMQRQPWQVRQTYEATYRREADRQAELWRARNGKT